MFCIFGLCTHFIINLNRSDYDQANRSIGSVDPESRYSEELIKMQRYYDEKLEKMSRKYESLVSFSKQEREILQKSLFLFSFTCYSLCRNRKRGKS